MPVLNSIDIAEGWNKHLNSMGVNNMNIQIHRNRDEFNRQSKRDELKNWKCKMCGVALIRIKYDVENLEGYIRKN